MNSISIHLHHSRITLLFSEEGRLFTNCVWSATGAHLRKHRVTEDAPFRCTIFSWAWPCRMRVESLENCIVAVQKGDAPAYSELPLPSLIDPLHYFAITPVDISKPYSVVGTLLHPDTL
jgi:hypothetical protein